MLKKFFAHLGVGLAIGWVVTTSFLWIYGAYDAPGLAVLRNETVWLIISALYGLISLIYDVELPLPAAIAIHFFGCAGLTFIGSWAAGLFEVFEPWPYWFIYVLPSFLVIYLIIGGVITLVERRRAKKINDKIN